MDTNTPGQDPTVDQGQDPNDNQGQVPTPQPNGQDSFDRSYVEALRKEAAQHRTELNRLKAEQEEAKRKAMEEQGQYQALYTQATQEAETLKSEVEALRQFKAQADERAENERKALLLKLPEDMRSAFESASVETINVVLAKILAPGESPGGGRPPVPTNPSKGNDRPPVVPQPGEPGWLEQYTKPR